MFFAAVNPMYIGHYQGQDYGMTQPRNAVYRHNGKVHQNTVYWANSRVAQKKGMQFYVGCSHDLHSIIQSGLILGGRHAVFFTAVNPLFVDQHKESRVRPDEFQTCSVQNHWNTSWCSWKVAQGEGLQFYQTRSNAIIFHNIFTCDMHRESGYMKSGEDLYNKVDQSPRSPQKAVRKPKLYHGRQDPSNF